MNKPLMTVTNIKRHKYMKKLLLFLAFLAGTFMVSFAQKTTR